jgi:glycine/D-amino acid oxidase-like deaminating enzyme
MGTVRVAVLGAGVSGLAAALALARGLSPDPLVRLSRPEWRL